MWKKYVITLNNYEIVLNLILNLLRATVNSLLVFLLVFENYIDMRLMTVFIFLRLFSL